MEIYQIQGAISFHMHYNFVVSVGDCDLDKSSIASKWLRYWLNALWPSSVSE